MQRRRFLRAALGLGGALAVGAVASLRRSRGWAATGDNKHESVVPGSLHSVSRGFHAFGTEMSLRVLHGDEALAAQAADDAVRAVLRVEAVMSLYRADSDLSRLNRAGVIDRPNRYLVDILRSAAEVSRQTGGAFDVSVQPLWAVYAEAARTGRLPSEAELAAVRDQIDWRAVEVQPERVRLLGRGMALTLNGIAQGFAADRAMDALRRHGIEHALVDAGEIAPLGEKAPGRAWTAGIQHPRQKDAYVAFLPLDGRCLATSGDYATTLGEGRRCSHLFDPRTGDSPKHYESLSVLAPTATLADAISTALYVLPPSRVNDLVGDVPHVDVFAVLRSGRVLKTPGFPA